MNFLTLNEKMNVVAYTIQNEFIVECEANVHVERPHLKC